MTKRLDLFFCYFGTKGELRKSRASRVRQETSDRKTITDYLNGAKEERKLSWTIMKNLKMLKARYSWEGAGAGGGV